MKLLGKVFACSFSLSAMLSFGHCFAQSDASLDALEKKLEKAKTSSAQPKRSALNSSLASLLGSRYSGEGLERIKNSDSSCVWERNTSRTISFNSSARNSKALEGVVEVKQSLVLVRQNDRDDCMKNYSGVNIFNIRLYFDGDNNPVFKTLVSESRCISGECQDFGAQHNGQTDEGVWELYQNGRELSLKYGDGTSRVYHRQ